jgi:hypothetical protein
LRCVVRRDSTLAGELIVWFTDPDGTGVQATRENVNTTTILLSATLAGVQSSACYSCNVQDLAVFQKTSIQACVTIYMRNDSVIHSNVSDPTDPRNSTTDPTIPNSNNSQSVTVLSDNRHEVFLLDTTGSNNFTLFTIVSVSAPEFQQDLKVEVEFQPQSGSKLSVLNYFPLSTIEEVSLNVTVIQFRVNISLSLLSSMLFKRIDEGLVWTFAIDGLVVKHTTPITVIPDERTRNKHVKTQPQYNQTAVLAVCVVIMIVSLVTIVVGITAVIFNLSKIKLYSRKFTKAGNEESDPSSGVQTMKNTWCFCSKGNRTLHEDQIVLQATYSGSSGRESAALESETSTNIA